MISAIALCLAWNAAIAPSHLADTTILIVRHAEKPEDGAGLTPAGEARAAAYAHYFWPFKYQSQKFKVDGLYAAADSHKSMRPRLTLEPLSHATGLKLDTRFSDKDPQKLVDALKTETHGRHLLVAWRHGEIPQLLEGLGADPKKLIPTPKWPNEVFDWVIELKFDKDAKLVMAQRIVEPKF